MIKKLAIFSFFILLFFSFSGLTVKAQSIKDTVSGLASTASAIPAFKDQATSNNPYSSAFFASYAGHIIGIVLSFVGVLFLGLIIYAGLMWMLAAGNEQEITKAKTLIINAIIGLIVVFAAYALTAFIGKNFLP